MGKAALGKGMKDLLAKNFGLEKGEGPEKDKEEAEDELKVNIERYQAQGLDVETLKQLKGKDSKKITRGIADFRAAVKVLNTAQTILRSLEGYGYTKEIESINEIIKDPSKADHVMKTVEDLRDRAQTEHDVGVKKKGSPGKKLSESLKEKSEMLRGNGVREGSIQIDESALDDLLDDLDDIGDAFSLEIEEDPFLSKVSEWEEKGYFVDKLKNSLAEDRDRAEKEAEQFESDVARMEEVKEIFKEMDLTGFHQEAQELMLKFQYPHLAQDVENELKRIKTIQENADSLLEGKEETEEPSPEEEIPSQEVDSSVVEEEPPEEEIAPSPEVDGPVVDEETPEEKDIPSQENDSPVAEEEPPEEEETPPARELVEETGPGIDTSSHSPEELMEMAKDAYKEGRMEESLTLFKELLKKDPDSSKARFMIRRISSKLGQ